MEILSCFSLKGLRGGGGEGGRGGGGERERGRGGGGRFEEFSALDNFNRAT